MSSWIAYWDFDFGDEVEAHYKYFQTEREAYECLSSVLSDCAYIGIRHRLIDFGVKSAQEL